jgi:CubicO group peptidase (beta-lactamase class C family)
MVRAIAELEPLAEPGTKTLYLSMTFGWILGELVRRADPDHRSLGRFVREEIAEPLGAPDLWIGIPDEAEPRIARQIDAMRPLPAEHLPPLHLASMPCEVALGPAVFERPEVRRAEIAGVGGIFTARSEARFWAMLAGGGELDGVRLLGPRTVAYMGRNHLPGDADLEHFGRKLFAESSFDGVGFGLGFSVVLDPAAGKVPSSAGEMAWGGAASTAFYLDPQEDLGALFMTQLLPSSTHGAIRPQLRQLVAQALVD